MSIRYVKALPENIERINTLLKRGYELYSVQKGFDGNPITLVFKKEENKE